MFLSLSFFWGLQGLIVSGTQVPRSQPWRWEGCDKDLIGDHVIRKILGRFAYQVEPNANEYLLNSFADWTRSSSLVFIFRENPLSLFEEIRPDWLTLKYRDFICQIKFLCTLVQKQPHLPRCTYTHTHIHNALSPEKNNVQGLSYLHIVPVHGAFGGPTLTSCSALYLTGLCIIRNPLNFLWWKKGCALPLGPHSPYPWYQFLNSWMVLSE